MPHASIDDREIHYRRRGEGPPLLLVQGMSGNHLAWGEPFPGALEGDFELIAYDHRGIGRSGRVSDPFTLVDLAEDAMALLDELGIVRAHVMGVSMGGMVAQEIALRHAERVDRLVLGCTYAGGPGSSLTSPEAGQRLLEAMTSGDRERALRVGYELNLSERFRADEGRYATFHGMATTLPAALEVLMLQMQAIVAHDTSARLREISAPTLVIHGTEDEMLAASNGEIVARLIPGARLELLEGVGHMFWWEEPERSAALVRDHVLAGTPAQA